MEKYFSVPWGTVTPAFGRPDPRVHGVRQRKKIRDTDIAAARENKQE
jgi:hypothetical protein